MFNRLRAAAAALMGSAAPQPTARPADPTQDMHDDLVRFGFTLDQSTDRLAFALERPPFLLIVMNRDGDGLPTPDDWSVGLYNTSSPHWPAEPTRCVELYARDNLPASFAIAFTAALAQMPRAVAPQQGE